MALQEVTQSFLRRLRVSQPQTQAVWTPQCRRHASDVAVREESDLEHTTFQGSAKVSPQKVEEYNPVKTARKRNRQLPSSRSGSATNTAPFKH